MGEITTIGIDVAKHVFQLGDVKRFVSAGEGC
jgi:hypothetical protein